MATVAERPVVLRFQISFPRNPTKYVLDKLKVATAARDGLQTRQ
jgi:hypothetical protein